MPRHPDHCYGCGNRYAECTCLPGPKIAAQPTCPKCGTTYTIGKNTQSRTYRCTDDCGWYFHATRQVTYVTALTERVKK